MAGAPKFKQDIKKYVEWTIHSISGQERVSVHLNSEVRAEDLKGKDYDAVIVAVGDRACYSEVCERQRGCRMGRRCGAWESFCKEASCDRRRRTYRMRSSAVFGKSGKEVTLVDMIDVCDLEEEAPNLIKLPCADCWKQNRSR